jgi:uncharacterized protein (DUF1684 family)
MFGLKLWRTALFVALSVGAAAADVVPPPGEAETKWLLEIQEANDAYGRKPTAILKIDDAIYLKPGESAWLTAAKPGESGLRWSLTAPEQPAPKVSFSADGTSARYVDAVLSQPAADIDLLAEGASPFELVKGGKLRLSAGMAQIEPGVDGLRVAVYNDDNPAAAAFTGLLYYPYDEEFVVEAAFEAAKAWTPKTFQTSRGWYKQFYHVGDAVFTLKGVAVRLPMYAGTDKLEELDSVAAFIMDETTGSETYGVGRYIDVAFAKGTLPTTLTIDFNFLYNPNCARSPHYNCPVAVDRITLPIRAGEKKPEGHG